MAKEEKEDIPGRKDGMNKKKEGKDGGDTWDRRGDHPHCWDKAKGVTSK